MAWHGWQLMIFAWFLFVIATLLVFVRLYVEFRIRSRPWRELFVLVAWIFYIVNQTLYVLEEKEGIYDDDRMDALFESNEAYAPAGKLLWAESFFYKPCIYFCKAALLCFYQDLTPPVLWKVWWAIRFSWVFLVIGLLFQWGISLFSCWPFYYHWWLDGADCNYTPALVCTSWALHVFTDILVNAIPFFILTKMENLTSGQRRPAYFMFGVGFVNVAMASLLLATVATPGGVSSAIEEIVTINNWMIVAQQGSAVIIICMPQVRRLWLGTSAQAMRPELKGLAKAVADVECGIKTPATVSVEEKRSNRSSGTSTMGGSDLDKASSRSSES